MGVQTPPLPWSPAAWEQAQAAAPLAASALCDHGNAGIPLQRWQPKAPLADGRSLPRLQPAEGIPVTGCPSWGEPFCSPGNSAPSLPHAEPAPSLSAYAVPCLAEETAKPNYTALKEIVKKKNSASQGKKKVSCWRWFHWGSNPGPSACKADVITTTLWNRHVQLSLLHCPY